jgi:hypothetical protein
MKRPQPINVDFQSVGNLPDDVPAVELFHRRHVVLAAKTILVLAA